MKIKSALFFALTFTLSCNTPLFAHPFSITSKNSQVELQTKPQTIAVYDLSILDTLNALGIDASIVPDSHYHGDLSRYAHEKFIKAGSLFEPDLEILKQAKPDLILIGGRSAKNLESLNKVAPTLDLSPNTHDYMNDLKQRTLSLAKAFNQEVIAQKKLSQVLELQSQLKTKTHGKTALMLFAVGDNFMPHAENDRFGFVYSFAGLTPVIKPSTPSNAPRPEAGSPEAKQLAEKNRQILQNAINAQPDYIIVLDRGAVNTQQYKAKDTILKHDILAKANAVKEGKVIFVNADAWYITGAGLNNTLFMLNELNQAIQK